MNSKIPSEDYLERVKLLSRQEIEQLCARMRGRFARRLEDRKLSTTEALALQLKYEDEGLNEWRERMAELNRLNEG